MEGGRPLANRIRGVLDETITPAVCLLLFDRFTLPGTDVRKLKERGDIRGLIRALGSRNSAVQYNAAEGLGDLGDERAVVPLIVALEKEGLSGVRWKAAEALSKIGTPAVEPLIRVLTHQDDDVRWMAAIALGEIGDQRAVGPLIHLLCDGDRFVKGRAAYALGEIGEPAVEPLISALQEGDGSLRWGAAVALGKIRDPAAIEPLIRALADKYENVRAEAATALAAMGKAALGPLIRFLKFSDKSLRIEVVTALGELKDSNAIHPLIQLLETADEEERKAIADSLDAILVPSVEPIVRKLRSMNGQDNSSKTVKECEMNDD